MKAFAGGLEAVERNARPDWLPDDATIARQLSARDPWFRFRAPRYPLQVIQDLARLVPGGRCRILDIGAGTGLIGETIASMFPGKSVVAVDVASNALSTLRIPFATFDGSNLPFADGSFDCALFCNVLHHVRPQARVGLLREALRVTAGGPIIIKDHLAAAPLDRLRLWALDVLGNAPRGFMVSAEYLGEAGWGRLLHQIQCRGEILPPSPYREGAWERCFPNRLEICFRIRRS